MGPSDFFPTLLFASFHEFLSRWVELGSQMIMLVSLHMHTEHTFTIRSGCLIDTNMHLKLVSKPPPKPQTSKIHIYLKVQTTIETNCTIQTLNDNWNHSIHLTNSVETTVVNFCITLESLIFKITFISLKKYNLIFFNYQRSYQIQNCKLQSINYRTRLRVCS